MTDTITLPARMDGSVLKDMLPTLVAAVKAKALCVDAQEVSHFGALGAQLILAAARDVRNAGGTFEMTAISDRAREQLAAMGLSPEMIMEGTQ